MTKRMAMLREAQRAAKPAISAERLLLATEAYKKYAGEPVWIFRAHILEYVLDHKAIVVRDGELLLGSATEKIRAGLIFPEYSSGLMWLKSELPGMPARETDPMDMTPKERDIILECLDYWDNKSTEDIMNETMPQFIKDAETAGAFKSGGRGLSSSAISMNFKRMLNHGFRWHIKDCQRRIEEAYQTPMTVEKEQKVLYWRSLIIVMEAVIRYARRNADEAERLAGETADETRRAELLEMARICRKVPEYEPETFWEAIQHEWMMHVVMHIECNAHSTQLHRFDVWFYPYYKKDLEAGKIDRERGIELIEQLMLKVDSLFFIADNYYAKANAGLPTWQNMHLGGYTPEGEDACNELTDMALDAAYEMRLSNPPFILRYNKKTSRKIIEKACRMIQEGLANPAFFSDETAIRIVLNKGGTLEEARDWCTTGCVETMPGCGHADGSPIGGYINMPKVLEITLHNGKDPRTGLEVGLKTGDPRDFKNIDELIDAYMKQLYHFADMHTYAVNATMSVQAHYLPCVYHSIFIDGCIERGKTIQEGGADYLFNSLFMAGPATAGDSINAVEYAVFQEKKMTMDELIALCDTNFEGREDLRQYLINRAPKYGNDIEDLDQRLAVIVEELAHHYQNIKDCRGGRYSAGNMTQTHNVPLGSYCGATPDGRLAYTPISDNASPMMGRDLSGPTASANSVAKMHIDQNHAAQLYNIRFDPVAVSGENGVNIIKGVFCNYCDNGGYHIQANVVDNETLRKAQKDPENYRDIVVRVSGYLAYFTELDASVQQTIIDRTIHLA